MTVIDKYTRECLSILVDGRIRSGKVVEELSRLVSLHGAPRHLRSDNGPEFVATAVIRWLTKNAIETAYIDPGKLWQNGADESFNGNFRAECLNMEWFRSRGEAKVVIEAWRQGYNHHRPHSSLDYLTPKNSSASCRGQNQKGPSSTKRWSEEIRQVKNPATPKINATPLDLYDS